MGQAFELGQRDSKGIVLQRQMLEGPECTAAEGFGCLLEGLILATDLEVVEIASPFGDEGSF